MQTKDTSYDLDRAVERHQTMRVERAPHEASWHQLREYFLPSRTFELRYGTPSIRKRRLVDTTGITAVQRLTGLIQGLMMNPYVPFILPSLGAEEPTPEEGRVLDTIGRRMHDRLINPQVHFPAASLETGLDETVFGNSVMWGGRNTPGGQESWQAQRLSEHFWSENADGVVDTDYREFTMSLRAAGQAFPKAEKIQEKYKDPKANQSEKLTFLHVVQPNASGMTRGFSTNKKFMSAIYCIDTKEQVRQGGYDTFPYAITRFTKQSGDPYGTGPALDALPLVRLLNEILETVARAGELAADPPLVNLAGRLPKIDRRPGGVTNVDAAFLRRAQDPGSLLKRLYEAGDVGISIELVRDLRAQINLIFFIDWLNIGEHVNMTATEVIERRNIRMATMTPIVSRIESEKLTPVAERQYELMGSGLFQGIDVPQELFAKDLQMRFNSPLARAQRQAEVETFTREIELLISASQLDEGVLESVDLAAETRDALKALGVDHRNIRTRKEMAARIAAREEAAAEAQQLEQAQGGAAALRDAAQAASVVGGSA